MMDSFVAKISPWRIGITAFGLLLFVIGGLWMTGAIVEPPPSSRYSEDTIFVIGWVCICFFGAAFIVGIRRLFGSHERLVVNVEGIIAVQWSDQLIPWSEIVEVTISKQIGSSFITLHLRDPDNYPGRGLNNWLRSANRFYAGGDVWINLLGTDKSLDEGMAAIDHFLAAASSKPRANL